MTPYGITYRQSQVLGWLALEKQLTQARLAEKMMIEPPTLAGILDRMERCGWITRDHCETDRRKKWIRATAEAEPAWEKIVACAKKIREQATAGLSDQQRAELRILLRLVNNNCQTDRGAGPRRTERVGRTK
jgi:MarR family transcriptional regulator for hemolysin